jgi:hypothetical protein
MERETSLPYSQTTTTFSLSWARWMQSTYCHPIPLTTFWMLYSKLYIGPLIGLLFRFPKYAELSALKLCYQQEMICKLLICFADMYVTITHSSHLLI